MNLGYRIKEVTSIRIGESNEYNIYCAGQILATVFYPDHHQKAFIIPSYIFAEVGFRCDSLDEAVGLMRIKWTGFLNRFIESANIPEGNEA